MLKIVGLLLTMIVGVSPTPTIQISRWNANFEGKTYAVGKYKLNKGDNLRLMLDKRECKAGINGGFYDTADRPLGLVIIHGQKLANSRKSSLFNGFVSVDNNNRVVIDGREPQNANYAVQTGPRLINTGRAITLKLKNDSFDRRMVIAQNKNGETWFLAIYGTESMFDGPKLAQLPKIIQLVSDKYGLNLYTAINMDGGTASAFKSPELALDEFARVGNWWCVN